MITGGITPRYVSSITTSNRAHGIQKGEILEKLSSGKSGDKIKDSVFITESKSTVLEGVIEDSDNSLAKIDKDLERLNDIISILTELNKNYKVLFTAFEGTIKLVYPHIPTEKGWNPDNWTEHNKNSQKYIDKITETISSPLYSLYFKRVGLANCTPNKKQTLIFKVDGIYNEPVEITLPEWANSSHRYLKIHNIAYIRPGDFGSGLGYTSNKDNHVGSMRYSYRVINSLIERSNPDQFKKVRDLIEAKKQEIIRNSLQLKALSETQVFFNNKSIKMILDDKKTSNQRVEYYNSLMDTLNSAEDMIEKNLKELYTIILNSSSDSNLSKEEVRNGYREDIKLRLQSIKNVIYSTKFNDEQLIGTFGNDGQFISRDEIIMKGLVENKKFYLYQSNLYLDELLQKLPHVLDDDKYKLFAATDGEFEEEVDDAQLEIFSEYNKDVMAALLEAALEDISYNKSGISDMMAKVANIEYLNRLSINNIEYIVSNIENIDVQEETIALMQVEVLENISSEAVMKVKDSAKVLMKLIQG